MSVRRLFIIASRDLEKEFRSKITRPNIVLEKKILVERKFSINEILNLIYELSEKIWEYASRGDIIYIVFDRYVQPIVLFLLGVALAELNVNATLFYYDEETREFIDIPLSVGFAIAIKVRRLS